MENINEVLMKLFYIKIGLSHSRQSRIVKQPLIHTVKASRNTAGIIAAWLSLLSFISLYETGRNLAAIVMFSKENYKSTRNLKQNYIS